MISAMFDAHVHFRQDALAETIIKYSAQRCSNVIVMPNTDPPIHDVVHINYYSSFYQRLAGEQCKVYLTAKLLPTTTTKDVEKAKKLGVVGFKLYPAGVTTNSNDGIPEDWLIRTMPHAFIDVLQAIEDNELVLLHHGEIPSSPVLDREQDYLKVFERLAYKYSSLRMTLEHISTVQGLRTIVALAKAGFPVMGTITLHHLQNSLEDLLGDKLRPDLFCKPILKTKNDQAGLMHAISSPYFAFGSDSAPHCVANKYCSHGCAGVFTAPVMLESMVQFLKKYNLFQHYTSFCGLRAAVFYRIGHINRQIDLVEKKWIVPNTIHTSWYVQDSGLTPYLAGQELDYKIKDQ